VAPLYAAPIEDCDDGVDNDHDGTVDCDDTDCTDDPACRVAPLYAAPIEDCDDDIDNDHDGDVDCDDSDCDDDRACMSVLYASPFI
jgi:hypothetical protein